MSVLFAAVHLLPKGVSKLVFSDSSDDPILARLEAVLGQRQPVLTPFWDREKHPLGLYMANRAGSELSLRLFRPFKAWTEAAEWTGASFLYRKKPVLG